ncbi:unnamed protein product [Symbiodinium sp. CCMP2456]|nr:unnamed protein product [Symbiodinium sp. CCMP2456]
MDTQMDHEILHHLDSAETLVLGQTQSLTSLPSVENLDGEPADDDELELEAARAAAEKYQQLLQKKREKTAAQKAEADRAAREQQQKAEAEKAALERAQKAEADRAALEQQQKAEAEKAALEQQQKAQAEPDPAAQLALLLQSQQMLQQAPADAANRGAREVQIELDREAEQQLRAQATAATLQADQYRETAERLAREAEQARQVFLDASKKAEEAVKARVDKTLEVEQAQEEAAAQAGKTVDSTAQQAQPEHHVAPVRTWSTLAHAASFDDTSLPARVVQTLVTPDTSAALAAKNPAVLGTPVKAGRTSRAKKDDFELPVLSEAEQSKYKNFWYGDYRDDSEPDHIHCWYCGDYGDDSKYRPDRRRTATSPTSAGNGLALEAVLRYKRQQEEEQKDEGLYYPWSEIVDFHSGDLEKATSFAEMRRRQARGTSWDRNDPTVETLLKYDEISCDIGCDPRYAASLMESFEKGNVIGQGAPSGLHGCRGEDNYNEGLEALESQETLIKLLSDAIAGMAEAAPFVEAFKKHQRVASISSEARVTQPKKKAKSTAPPPEKVLCGHLEWELLESGRIISRKGDTDWVKFWSDVQTESWGRTHPVQSWDEVMQSEYFAYDKDGVNITLQQFQADLVRSLQKCADASNGLGHTLHVVAGKGDWAWRAQWLQQIRFYNNKLIEGPAAGLCARCLCTRDTWLDVHERFNAPADLATARLTAVGDIALKSLPGWDPDMEVPDLLHVLWTGTGRDLIGSLCLQIVETSQSYTGSTYDERLRHLRRDMQAWCVANGIRPSTVEEISTLGLIIHCFYTHCFGFQ